MLVVRRVGTETVLKRPLIAPMVLVVRVERLMIVLNVPRTPAIELI